MTRFVTCCLAAFAIFLGGYSLVSQAATVVVNGATCGDLLAVQIKGNGDVAISTIGGTCGSSLVTPPVITPTYPDNVRVVDATWPNMSQKTYTQRQGEVLAIRVKTTEAGVIGKVATAYTSGNAGSRLVALSSRAGDFSVPKECQSTGTQSTTTSWVQGGDVGTYRCRLPVNGEAWVNVKHVYCDGVCEFYLRTY